MLMYVVGVKLFCRVLCVVMCRLCKLCGCEIFTKGSRCKCQGSMEKLLKAWSVLAEHKGWSVGQRCLYHIERYRNAKNADERKNHKRAINRLIKIKYVK